MDFIYPWSFTQAEIYVHSSWSWVLHENQVFMDMSILRHFSRTSVLHEKKFSQSSQFFTDFAFPWKLFHGFMKIYSKFHGLNELFSAYFSQQIFMESGKSMKFHGNFTVFSRSMSPVVYAACPVYSPDYNGVGPMVANHFNVGFQYGWRKVTFS